MNVAKKKVICVVGTRPEVIKMASVIHRLHQESSLEVSVLSTAQHREMLDQMLNLFQITPDQDLNIMQFNQTIADLTVNIMPPIDKLLKEQSPDLILAQGDTTTAFTVSLAGFYNKIPYGHVEAGLRSGSPFDPYPEEMNRTLISRLSMLDFAPTESAKNNLVKEGVPQNKIHITGNTVIDAMHYILQKDLPFDDSGITKDKMILVTAHRRENIGENLENICKALLQLVNDNENIQIFYPVHPNPNVKSTVYDYLDGHPRIILSEPVSYERFLRLMKRAYFIMSDSGGVQEEAPALGIPALVLRETTERPEGCLCGATKLIGTKTSDIVMHAQELLDNRSVYDSMVSKGSPYGDGMASDRIAKITLDFLTNRE